MANVKLGKWRKRKLRIRKKVRGNAVRPRLTIYRSNKYLYAQMIDDCAGVTLVAANTVGANTHGNNSLAAESLGKLVAQMAMDKKLSTVVFDRNGYSYHGTVRRFAEAARGAGLRL